MSIEIIAIGNEVLSGMTINSNAAYLGKRLAEEGWVTNRHTVLPDDRDMLTKGLQEALKRSSLVIATGGLGPTIDDITSSCAATLFEEVSQTIPNSVGSALGLIYRSAKHTLILLPGIPTEMEPMFEESVLPYLHKMFPPKEKLLQEALHLALLKEQEVDPFLRELKGVECGIYPAYGTLTVRLTSKDKSALQVAVESVKKKFGSYLFPTEKIEEAIHEWFLSNQMTLALAESCTGGLIAAHLVAIPEASKYFLGSLVTYSDALKKNVLGVSANTLKTKGAVSREAATEMLQGVFKVTGADYGIAVTGIAGPSGGSAEKPVGTIWYAIGQNGKPPEIGTFLAKGNRRTIILQASHKLLGLLYQMCSKS